MPPSNDLLLRLFESEQFNVHLAVTYLKTHSTSIGVTYYLVNRLAHFPEEEVEFYWPQLCHLLITRQSDSGALEGFISKKCEESVHLAMLTLWQLQASLSDLASTPTTPQFATCRRVYNRVQHIIFSDPLSQSSSSSQGSAQREKIGYRLTPTAAGLGVLAAAIAMPSLSWFSGKVAIEEAKRDRPSAGELAISSKSGSPELGGLTGADDNSEDEATSSAQNGRSHSMDKPASPREPPLSPRRFSLDPPASPRSPGKGSPSLSSSSSFKASRSAKASKKQATPSYLPGAPIPLVMESSSPSPSYRQPPSLSGRRKHTLAPPEARRLAYSHSMTELSSPTSATFTAPRDGEVTAESSPSNRVTFDTNSSPSSSNGTRRNDPYQSPSLSLPPNASVSFAAARAQESKTAQRHRNARSTPALHPYSSSTSSLQHSQSTSALISSVPPETLRLLLRSYACRSQLDLLTRLQDISTRLVVVPKIARLSALRAELTVLNHGLPRGCCLCLGCSGKGGGAPWTGDSAKALSRQLSFFATSVFSAPAHKQQYHPHHRIVRISPSESVVLNSADRAPFLIHVEVLEDDLDFDPTRRQNAEDIRAVTAEGESTSSSKSRTTSAELYTRARSQDDAGYGGLDSPNSFLSQSTTHRAQSGSQSARHQFNGLTGHGGLGGGVSEIGMMENMGDLDSRAGPPQDDEEVDLVEQLYGDVSVQEATAFQPAEFHPQIHNRSVDEAAWKRAEARKSFQLASPGSHGALSPAAASPGPGSGGTSPMARSSSGNRPALTIDEYAERMRMAAIMLAQLKASQQLPMTGTEAVTGVVGAGVGIGVNLTYGVGSVVGSVVGVGMDAVRASFGGPSRRGSMPSSGTQTPGALGQASSGIPAAMDSTTAASSIPAVLPTSPPLNGSAGLQGLDQQARAGGSASPVALVSAQQARQRVLSAQEAAMIRERIMSEMMALEEERMARMRASSRASNGRRLDSGSLSAAQMQSEATEEESIVMRAVNKDDPSGAVFQESWPDKKSRIRAASPYGHLANWDVFSVIVKTGADLRQEQLAVQLIKEFGRIWTETKCPHWVRYFRILVTSESTGLMETITDAVSVHSIKKEAYAKMTSAPSPENAGGVIPSFTLYDHFLEAFGSPNTLQFRKAQDAFMKSLASYSIISYLLQIKDRHNGNILLDKLGHLMHIDFGFMLSNSPGSIGFEMAPFKLTQDYIEILGGMDSPKFAEYRSLLKQQFRIVRQHAERIITMVELMQTDSRLPCFSVGEATSQQLRDRFQLGLPAAQADEFVDKLVISSAGSAFTRLYDTFQRHSQGVL